MNTLVAQRAHAHSMLNRSEILNSRRCGCFYCQRIYAPRAIVAWTDRDQNGGRTALCPYCAVDSVIGDASGYEIDPAFLKMLRQAYFDVSKSDAPVPDEEAGVSTV